MDEKDIGKKGMQINRVNNVSFQRAIKVNSASNRVDKNKRVNDSTRNVFYTLYGYDERSAYDSEKSKKISEFLNDVIGDYNDDGFYLRKINGEIYIFTGREYRCVRRADEALAQANNYARDKETLDKNSQIRDKYLLTLVENGKKGKPRSEISIDMDEKHEATKISYLYEAKDRAIYQELEL